MLRLFIVGCPRSGTTLLQTILLSSGKIISFPESHFFHELAKCPRRFPKGMYGQKLVNRWLGSGQFSYSKKYITGLRESDAVTYFKTTLDDISQKNNKDGWLEKTPENVKYVELIKKHIPDAKFVHVLRSYQDNVASFHLARKEWGNERAPIVSVKDWFQYISQSLLYLNEQDHLHVSYEQLVNDPDVVINKLSDFIKIQLPKSEDLNLNMYASNVINKQEAWKSSNLNEKGIAKMPKKYDSTFSAEEKNEIEAYIDSCNRWLAELTGTD